MINDNISEKRIITYTIVFVKAKYSYFPESIFYTSSVVRADKDSEHYMIVILCYVTLKLQTKFLKTYYCCYESTFQMILRIIVTLASS